jgi:hypothetical protein
VHAWSIQGIYSPFLADAQVFGTAVTIGTINKIFPNSISTFSLKFEETGMTSALYIARVLVGGIFVGWSGYDNPQQLSKRHAGDD